MSGQSFQEALLYVQETVEVTLNQALERYAPAYEGAHLHEAMAYALLGGGKRLRAFLVWVSAFSLSKEEDYGKGVSQEAIFQVAGALECLHAYSLVHDDLPAMDNDDIRRGRPTVHRHYDEATAILVGDALQTMAFEMLVDSAYIQNPVVQSQLVRLLARASGAGGMILGQHLDLLSENNPLQARTFDMIHQIQRAKTGALITAGCQMGAVLGNASQADYQTLTVYGDVLGLAFQMKDDLLDHSSTLDILGKATRKDKQRGKATFVSLEGEEIAIQRLALLIQKACERVDALPSSALLRACAFFIGNRSF